VPEALLTFARAENATQLVLGVSRRSWLASLLTGPGVSARTMRASGDIDVHMVTHSYVGRGRGLPRAARGGLTRGRKLAGYALAVALMPLLTLILTNVRGHLNLTSNVLVFLAGVVAVALVGGFLPALIAAVAGSLLLNYYFTPPLYKFTINDPNNALALIIFIAVGLAVSSVVDTAARRTKQAARAGAESELLTTTAGSILRGQRALAAVLERVREAFGMDSVTLLERAGTDPEAAVPGPDDQARRSSLPVRGGRWAAVGVAGEPAVSRPEDADAEMPISDSLVLALRGRTLAATDRRVLGAFAAYAAAALEQGRLAAAAEAARPIAEADRVRTALAWSTTCST
jgi:two-component system sensor histidine kinase KdpD